MESISPREIGLPQGFTVTGRPWRIGVIGFGRHAKRAHVPDYRLSGWTVAAVSSRSQSNRHAAEASGIDRVYSDYRQLLEDQDVEVVSLLAQPELREEAVRAAIDLGKPIIMEKPAALSLLEGERMASLSSTRKVPVAVNLNYRWMVGNFLAARIVELGLLGEIQHLSIENFGRQDELLSSHEYYSSCADFLTVHWGVHFADLQSHLLKRPPKRVVAHTSRGSEQCFKSDNFFSAIFDYGSTLTGVVTHSQLIGSSLVGNRCRIDGDAGTLIYDFAGKEMLLSCREYPSGVKIDTTECSFPESICGSTGEFLLSLEEGRESALSIQQHLPVMRVLDEQVRSAKLGQWRSLGA